MPKAVWKGVVLAESAKTIVVDGCHYFPNERVDSRYLRQSDHHSTCPWKGRADYYHAVVGSLVNEDAAWIYRAPSEEAEQITGYIAFGKDIAITP